jgi:O-antigen/teichoic acid export membrane protein
MEAPPPKLSALEVFAARVGRYTGIYGLASGAALLVGIVSLAVLTRFLPPAEFGRLAALMFFSALVTVIYNLGLLQGMNRALYGSAGDEDIPDDDAAPTTPAARNDVVVTGLVATAALAFAGTVVVSAAAPQVAEFLVGDTDAADAARWAAVAGGLASMWRLAANVVRLENRPLAWGALNVARPTLALAVAIPLLSSGEADVVDVLIGWTVGNALALALTIATLRLRRPRTLSVVRGGADLVVLGAGLIPVALAMWVLQNGDILMLSQLATNEDLGLYRAGSRIGAVAAYATAAFFLAYGPLRRAAGEDVAGESARETVAEGVTTYYLAASTGLVLALALLSDLLIDVAAPAYSEAAPLIPLTAAGAVSVGALRLSSQLATFPQRRRAFIAMCVVSAVAFVPLAIVAIELWGSYGAAVAVAIAPLLGVLGLAIVARRAGASLFPAARAGIAAVVLGAACLTVGLLFAPESGPARVVVTVVALLEYPLLLIVTGIIPSAHVARLGPIGRRLLRDTDEQAGHTASSLAWRGMYALAVLLAGMVVILTALGLAGVDPS